MPGKATGVPQVGCDVPITAPATALAAKWDGWGTALKPAWEPIVLARKPLIGTVAQNVLEHGTGALNIDGCRVGTEGGTRKSGPPSYKSGNALHGSLDGSLNGGGCESIDAGRFPANLLHDGSEEVLAGFPVTGAAKASMSGLQHSGRHGGMADLGGNIADGTDSVRGHNDLGGSAARFFYCAKASKQDRDEGCESMPAVKSGMSNGAQLHGEGYDKGQDIGLNRVIQRRNHHPTVKPTALMRYLVKLVSRPGHTILDPFSGSGSTGKAAILEARQFLGIELQPEYVQIATARLSHAVKLHQESSAQHSAVTHH
jgi:site-specific DNA-methyltransferase (adenine-specific)